MRKRRSARSFRKRGIVPSKWSRRNRRKSTLPGTVSRLLISNRTKTRRIAREDLDRPQQPHPERKNDIV